MNIDSSNEKNNNTTPKSISVLNNKCKFFYLNDKKVYIHYQIK